MFKFKHVDKEDYRLTPEDVLAYAKAAKASYHAHLKLCKWNVAVKLKNK